jgi:peptide/nickel transport system substrate-binding protein
VRQPLRAAALAGSAAFSTLAAPAAAQDEGRTLRIPHELGWGGAESPDPISPDRFFEVAQTVYSRLVRQGYDGSIEPDLATEWSSSEDATTWTFELRDGVTFHDGQDFTAEDVVFSLMRIQSEAIDSPVRAVLDIIDEAVAVDVDTVEVRLSSPHADFPLLLTDYRVRMLDATTCGGDLDALCTAGVGTGPFVLEGYDPAGTTTLTRFEDYWEGPAGVERMEIIAIPDQEARIAALQAGQIDIVFEVTGQQAPLFEGREEFVVQRTPTGRWLTLAMNTQEPPFDDPRVRKALRTFVDREAMGKLVLGEGGYVVACDTPVWSGDPYRADLSCPPDPEGARALLAEAGAEGLEVELIVSDIVEGVMRLAEVYQAQAQEAGIDVELVVAPADGYWSDVWMQEPFVASSWSQRPADQALNEIYRAGASWNETYYDDPAFEETLDAARQELDPEGRRDLYGELQRTLWEEGGSFIPFHINGTRVVRSSLSGIPEVEVFTVRFQDIEKSE